MENIEVTIKPIQSLDDVGEMWLDLEARSDGSFFTSWHWVGSWLKELSQLPKLLCASLDGKVVGLAAISDPVMSRSRLFNTPTIYLNQTGDFNLDAIAIEYNGLLVDRHYQHGATEACINHLFDRSLPHYRGWLRLMVSGIIDPTAFRQLCENHGCTIRDIATTSTIDVDLEEVRSSEKDYLASLSSNTRSQIKRSIRGYSELGELTVERPSTAEEALSYFESLGQYNKSKWIEKSNHSNFDIPYFVNFHRRLIRDNFSNGSVELLRVVAGKKEVAYLYNYIYRKKVYFYSSGLVFENNNKLKPGLTAHYLCIANHIEKGNNIYDFMAGESQYKSSLGKKRYTMKSISIQKRHLYFAIEQLAASVKSTFTAKTVEA